MLLVAIQHFLIISPARLIVAEFVYAAREQGAVEVKLGALWFFHATMAQLLLPSPQGLHPGQGFQSMLSINKKKKDA